MGWQGTGWWGGVGNGVGLSKWGWRRQQHSSSNGSSSSSSIISNSSGSGSDSGSSNHSNHSNHNSSRANVFDPQRSPRPRGLDILLQSSDFSREPPNRANSAGNDLYMATRIGLAE